jgi:DNA-binding winged helix-turn-helix (wHTH) protein
VAHQARIYNYWLGGKDNYAADRQAADAAVAAYPGVASGARANRQFLARAVRLVAGEGGIRQFLDIGTGIPTADNTHEVAQSVAPASRVVYADYDPVVLAHARALPSSSAEGATEYLNADLRDTANLLAQAARTLDFGQPVAIMLIAILVGSDHIPSIPVLLVDNTQEPGLTSRVTRSALLSNLVAGTAESDDITEGLSGDRGTLLAVVPVADSTSRLAIVGYLIPADEAPPGGPPAGADGLRPDHGGLLVDAAQHRVTADGRDTGLVFREFELLAFLAANPGWAFTRAQLLTRVWAGLQHGTTRTVDIHIHRLRRKLGPEYGQRLVTVRGVGYMYQPPNAEPCVGQPEHAA